MPNDKVRETLHSAIDAVLAPLLSPGLKCAFVDFPNHSNAGDSAIWIGETDWLRRRGVEVVYSCDIETYSRARMLALLGEGTVLLHGGGNLGDIWLHHQRFREMVISDFPDNRIVQFPQTIHFDNESGIQEVQRQFDSHQDFTLLCRDNPSLQFAKQRFACPVGLCPDMVFAMDALQRPADAECDILWLARTDKESTGAKLPQVEAGIRRMDWLGEPVTDLRRTSESLAEQLLRSEQDWRPLAGALSEIYDLLARERLLRGCRVLSQGRVVVTDRLHGHILCLMMSIPHVLLDNNYGKVRGFYETWTRSSSIAHWADSPAEAIEIANALVESCR
jgi:exopolysaccharide biosynthesis predicted pyruvyltransferase EpsI